jgi:dephospho-CoA kinase
VADARPVVLLEIPLFFEVRLPEKYFYDSFCVAVAKDKQIKRLIDRNQLTREDTENRIAAQMPMDENCRRSLTVIWNTATSTNSGTRSMPSRCAGTRGCASVTVPLSPADHTDDMVLLLDSGTIP